MKLILVDDEGVYLDSVDVAEDEFDYAKEDGGAATLILGELLPFRDGNEPQFIYIAKGRGPVRKFTNNAHLTHPRRTER